MPNLAAIDIGSNSVRMMTANVTNGRIEILAQDRQVTRLGESVFRDGRISEDALKFLCTALANFAAVYRQLSVSAVRAVATSAVRDASNQEEFLRRTTAALGANVEVISGPEEARLIHLGVQSRWPRPKERTLMIDVGGGSAELIISHSDQLIDAVSKPLGAVRLTELFLKSDPPSQVELAGMHAFIDEKLAPFYRENANEKFDRVIATSATAGAIIASANQIARAKREEGDRQSATIAQVEDLYSRLTKSDVATRRKMVGIGPRRAEIVVAGTGVFLRSLQMFGLKSLYYSVAGVRDGLIADLAARGGAGSLSYLSIEQRTVVQEMAGHYHVNLHHCAHVAELAHMLLEDLQSLHKLPPDAGKVLEAAAFLHDIGHYVSGTGHHKHSAYLVCNSDMPNFTEKERSTIAALCRFHRKSMPQPRHAIYQSLDPAARRTVLNLVPILRIADALDCSQQDRVPKVRAHHRNGEVLIELATDGAADLEIWAANQAAKALTAVYGVPAAIQRAGVKMA